MTTNKEQIVLDELKNFGINITLQKLQDDMWWNRKSPLYDISDRVIIESTLLELAYRDRPMGWDNVGLLKVLTKYSCDRRIAYYHGDSVIAIAAEIYGNYDIKDLRCKKEINRFLDDLMFNLIEQDAILFEDDRDEHLAEEMAA